MKRIIVLAMVSLLIAVVPMACAKPAPVAPAPAVTPKAPAAPGKPAPAAEPGAPVAPKPAVPPVAPKKVDIGWCTAAPGTTAYAQGIALAAMLKKYSPGIVLTVIPGKGSSENMAWLYDGRIDVTNSTSVLAPEIMTGTGFWKGRSPFKELRIMYTRGEQPTVLVVPKGSPIKTFYDLKGKRLGVQAKTASLAWPTFWLLDKVFKPGEVKVMYYSPSSALGDALRDGQIDAFMNTAPAYQGWTEELGIVMSLEFLDIPAELIDKVLREYSPDAPGTVVRAVITKGVYKGQDRDIPCYGATSETSTTTRMPDDVIYEITKVFFDHLDEVIAITKSAEELKDPKTVLAAKFAPYHLGAERYYKERGWIK